LIRNKKGQFIKGSLGETSEERNKRILSLREAQKRSPDYLGELKFSPLYNIWRSFKHTKKGLGIGNSKEWDKFKNFYSDMKHSYQKGLRLGRLDKTKPVSKENCMWMTDSELAFSRSDQLILEYKGKTKLLKEWASIYGLPYNAVKQRFQKGKNHNPHEILFGKLRKTKGKITDIKELTYQEQKNKISKMLSAYKATDKRKGSLCNYTKDWLLTNIFEKPCTYCNSNFKIGCDRIDNTKGHTIENTIPACYTCNTLRQNEFSVEEMKLIGKLVRKIKDSRNLEVK
jgi:hypothetical protein